jgi:hypothetical protein
VKRHLQTGLPAATFTSMLMTFSAQTSANMTQVRRQLASNQHCRALASM